METTFYFSPDFGKLTVEKGFIAVRDKNGSERSIFKIKGDDSIICNNNELMEVNLLDYNIAKITSFYNNVLAKKDKFEVSIPSFNTIFYCIKIFNCAEKSLVFIPNIQCTLLNNIDGFIKNLNNYLPESNYEYYLVFSDKNFKNYKYCTIQLNGNNKYEKGDEISLNKIFENKNCQEIPNIFPIDELSLRLLCRL